MYFMRGWEYVMDTLRVNNFNIYYMVIMRYT